MSYNASVYTLTRPVDPSHLELLRSRANGHVITVDDVSSARAFAATWTTGLGQYSPIGHIAQVLVGERSNTAVFQYPADADYSLYYLSKYPHASATEVYDFGRIYSQMNNRVADPNADPKDTHPSTIPKVVDFGRGDSKQLKDGIGLTPDSANRLKYIAAGGVVLAVLYFATRK